MTNASSLDRFFRAFIFTQSFKKGWGNPEHLKRIINFRHKLAVRHQFVPRDYPIYIDKELKGENGVRVLQGHFLSPFVENLPGIMPKESEIARFQMVLPTVWKTPLKPMCIHLSRTGDHTFDHRRTKMALPLLKEDGIGSIILENPYYGDRKPKDQTFSSLRYVTDLFAMGFAVVLEISALFQWCERMGLGPFGITGISLGGFMASLAAANWPKPISLIPCMSWSTASVVYTEGVLKTAIPWHILEKQFLTDDSYATEIMELIHSPEPSWKKYKDKLKYREEIQKLSETDSTAPVSVAPPPVPEPKPKPAKSDHIGSQPLHVAPYQSVVADRNQGTSIANKNVDSQQSSISLVGTISQSVSYASSLSTSISGITSSISSGVSSGVSSISSVASSFKPKLPAPKPKSQLRIECEHFMRGVMDECTHLGNYSVPVDPELIIILAADFDAYIPRTNVLPLDELWPGAQVRYLPHGHVAGSISHDSRQLMRQAIRDSFKIQIDKYYS